jgi:hypothetical protein
VLDIPNGRSLHVRHCDAQFIGESTYDAPSQSVGKPACAPMDGLSATTDGPVVSRCLHLAYLPSTENAKSTLPGIAVPE